MILFAIALGLRRGLNTHASISQPMLVLMDLLDETEHTNGYPISWYLAAN